MARTPLLSVMPWRDPEPLSNCGSGSTIGIAHGISISLWRGKPLHDGEVAGKSGDLPSTCVRSTWNRVTNTQQLSGYMPILQVYLDRYLGNTLQTDRVIGDLVDREVAGSLVMWASKPRPVRRPRLAGLFHWQRCRGRRSTRQ